MSHVTLWREDPWRLAPGFLQTLSHLPFPFGYALPPFTVVSHNRDNDYILGPVSSLIESPNLGMVGGPQHTQLQRKTNTPSFKGILRPMLKFVLFRCNS